MPEMLSPGETAFEPKSEAQKRNQDFVLMESSKLAGCRNDRAGRGHRSSPGRALSSQSDPRRTADRLDPRKNRHRSRPDDQRRYTDRPKRLDFGRRT